jgi:hypothetical protein
MTSDLGVSKVLIHVQKFHSVHGNKIKNKRMENITEHVANAMQIQNNT